MAALQPVDIYKYALQAGFSPDQAVTMTAIGMAESGGNLAAHNPEGEDSRGIWQVNLEAHPQYAGLDVHDPLVNAKMAYEVSVQGTDIRPWTVTHANNPQGARYLQYREAAEEAARLAGHPDAQGQWNPPGGYGSAVVGAGPGGDAPPPEFPSPEPEVDATAAAATDAEAVDDQADEGPDSSGDGLLDEYKAMVGLDADATDTDQDGFSDAYELQYGTDARDYFSNPLAGTDQQVDGEAPPLTTELPPDPEQETPAPSAGPGGSQPQPVAAQTAAAGSDPFQVAADSVQPPPGTAPATPDAQVAEGSELDVFLDAALSQQGATYIFGSEESSDDPDPMSDGVASYDCSSLIRWAAAQAGVDFTNGSWLQYLDIQEADTELTVEEALNTPGALLFNFSEEPTAGGERPSSAHVAISVGNGRELMEARGTKYGVDVFGAEGREFSHAGFIPELAETELTEELMTTFEGDLLTEPLPLLEESLVDSSGDGLLDEYKTLLGLDAFSDDSDSDGFLDSYELQYGTDPLSAESTPLVGEPGDEVPALDDEGELIPAGVDDGLPGPGDDVDGGAALAGDGGDDAFGDDDYDDGDSDFG